MMTDAVSPSGVTTAAPLQMLRAEVNVREFQRWAGIRRLQDTDHAMHCLLKETFGELSPKPFRLIVPPGGSRGCLYGYGPATAADSANLTQLFAGRSRPRSLTPSRCRRNGSLASG